MKKWILFVGDRTCDKLTDKVYLFETKEAAVKAIPEFLEHEDDQRELVETGTLYLDKRTIFRLMETSALWE